MTDIVGELNRDVLDCGDAEATYREIVKHLRWRASCEAGIARDLRQTANAARQDADEHSDRATEFLQLANAIEQAPVTFAARGIEAATAAETPQSGSVHESPVAESDAPKGAGR